jgi:hypothetical protein
MKRYETLEILFGKVDLSFAETVLNESCHAKGSVGRPLRNLLSVFKAHLLRRLRCIQSDRVLVSGTSSCGKLSDDAVRLARRALFDSLKEPASDSSIVVLGCFPMMVFFSVSRKLAPQDLYAKVTNYILRNMRRKVAVVLISCILVMVVASLELRFFDSAGQPLNENLSKTSSSSLVEDTGSVGPAGVDQEVIIEGNLTGSLFFIPEGMPPWNYELVTNGGTVGVLWNCPADGRSDYDNTPVRVYGVVKEGFMAYGESSTWNGSMWLPPSVQFVEAERIELLP